MLKLIEFGDLLRVPAMLALRHIGRAMRGLMDAARRWKQRIARSFRCSPGTEDEVQESEFGPTSLEIKQVFLPLPGVPPPKDTFAEAMQLYDVEGFLGEGAFSKIWQVKVPEKSERFALKLFKQSAPKGLLEREKKAIHLINRLTPVGKELFVELMDSHVDPDCQFLLYERLGVNLHHFTNATNAAGLRLAPEPLRRILHQICKGMTFLHSWNIIHTDLKPENVAFVNLFHGDIIYSNDIDARIKIIDLGNAVSDKGIPWTTNAGTRMYRAPEVIAKTGWSKPMDVWSVGCMGYELLSGEVLFPATECSDILAQQLMQFPENIPLDIRKAWIHMYLENLGFRKIVECLRRDPFNLMVLEQPGGDYFLLDVLTKMLNINQQERSSFEEILKHAYFQAR